VRPPRLVPARPHGVLADPLPQVIVEVEKVAEQAGQPRETGRPDRLLERGDRGLVNTVGVLGRPRERRCETLDENAALQPVGPVLADVAGQLTSAEREGDHRDVAQVELAEHRPQVLGERVEDVARRRPARPAEAAPVVGDHPVARLEQRRDLRRPRLAVERPSVEQDHGSPLPRSSSCSSIGAEFSCPTLMRAIPAPLVRLLRTRRACHVIAPLPVVCPRRNAWLDAARVPAAVATVN
jgi:hypothetical protein